MCGIVGLLSFGDREELTREETFGLLNPLRFRGPDAEGQISFRQYETYVWLGHKRLSIIDLSEAGNQPMQSASNRSVIVFNGEIYNYKKLQQQLVAAGVTFRTHSDTEVILNAYECWGIDEMLQRLDGMFAFAIFDKAENKLHLARDRFGKKPLYYAVGKREIVFSSDIRSFKALESTPLHLNLHSIGYFFAEYGTPQVESCWREVRKVPPAHYLTFTKDTASTSRKYWQLEYTSDCNLSRPDLLHKADELLTNAVRKRLVADVRVSALLSGGIDSSLIVAKIAMLESGQRVKTYSVGFKQKNFDELPFSRKVAERFNSDHTELIVEPANFDKIDELIGEYGEPFADSSMIPSYLMFDAIAKSEKVVLGGDGGDELFAGYDSYYFALKYDKVKHLRALYPLVAMMRKFLPGYRIDFLCRLLKQTHRPSYTLLHRAFCFSSSELRRLFSDAEFFEALDREHEAIWNENSNNAVQSDLIKVLQSSLSTRLLNDYLVKVDRASMFSSLEMRSPFLDRDVAEFCATLTPDQLFYNQEPKSILKDLALNYFDEAFVYRKKMGFAVPIAEWFRDELNGKLKDVVLGGRQNMLNLNYQYIEELIIEHTSGKFDHAQKLWSLYVFHIWANKQ
jgi:asparagine synthase (glutamine-hydrolysing)